FRFQRLQTNLGVSRRAFQRDCRNKISQQKSGKSKTNSESFFICRTSACLYLRKKWRYEQFALKRRAAQSQRSYILQNQSRRRYHLSRTWTNRRLSDFGSG